MAGASRLASHWYFAAVVLVFRGRSQVAIVCVVFPDLLIIFATRCRVQCMYNKLWEYVLRCIDTPCAVNAMLTSVKIPQSYEFS